MTPGDTNHLTVARSTSVGLFLTDGSGNDVLMPKKFVTPDMKIGQKIRVFVYFDSEDRLVATTQEPYLRINQFGFLKVKDQNRFGAFMDWGLDKDLMVPYRLQLEPMQVNEWYPVFLFFDEKSNRLVGSAKILNHVQKDHSNLEEGQQVDLLVIGNQELGLDVIIDNTYKGLVYKNDIFTDLIPGDRATGYIKRLRSDGKIDVTLRKTGLDRLEDGAQKILDQLKSNNNFLPLTDKSNPEDIKYYLEMSKRNFKQALGTLYKKRLVTIEPDGIRTTE